jgi:hypothetical protein
MEMFHFAGEFEPTVLDLFEDGAGWRRKSGSPNMPTAIAISPSRLLASHSTRATALWTEMIGDGAILDGPHESLRLAANGDLILQIPGPDPEW